MSAARDRLPWTLSTQEARGVLPPPIPPIPPPALRIPTISTAPPARMAPDQAKRTAGGPPRRSTSGVASATAGSSTDHANQDQGERRNGRLALRKCSRTGSRSSSTAGVKSEEHTSELQSLAYLVCRLLLEKKKHMNAHRVLQP